MDDSLVLALRSAATGAETKEDAYLFDAAADLIEQQAARITESESHRNDLADKIVEQKTEIGALKARITALESERATLLHEVEIHARWQPIETAPEGRLVVVAWLDKDDPKNPERHMFDFIEDDGWVKHNEDYDHFCCVAPPGSTGPSADAPYTHWLLIPDIPGAPANQKQAG